MEEDPQDLGRAFARGIQEGIAETFPDLVEAGFSPIEILQLVRLNLWVRIVGREVAEDPTFGGRHSI